MASAASGVSAWSPANSFTTTVNSAVPPVLSLPANGAVNQSQNLTLSWSPVTNATGYNLQFSDNPAFTTVLLTLNNLSATSQPISGLAFGDTYYWRISTINSTGTSQWSTPHSFTTSAAVVTPPSLTLNAPVLQLPADRATGVSRTPVLTWNAVEGITSYQLQVSNSNAFTTTVINEINLNQSSYTVTAPLSGRTLYYLRVRAVNNGVTGPWSTVIRFTTIR
jgi:hypothetical protein